MLEIKELNAGYASKSVLSDINITMEPGEVTVLLGPNGCGKSTLLKSISGIVPVTNGEVLLDGRELTTLAPKERAKLVSYLAQNRQVPETTVRKMVLHGRFPYLGYPRHYKKEDEEIADAAIAQMGITDLAHTQLGQLSGGQRQRVYIAMALAQDTPVVLLDEPTTFLDVSYQLQLMDQVRKLSDIGKTVVMVIHDLSHALRVADKVILMNGGKVVDQGKTDEVFARGHFDHVFNVKLNRLKGDSGWHYIYE